MRVAGRARPRSTAVATPWVIALLDDSIVRCQVGAGVLPDHASEDPGRIGGAGKAQDEPNDLALILPSGRTHQVPATVAGGSAPMGDHHASLGNSGATGGDGKDNYNDILAQLIHGIANLRVAMAVEGTTVFRFAEAIDAFDGDDEWANKYGAAVTNLHEKPDLLSRRLPTRE